MGSWSSHQLKDQVSGLKEPWAVRNIFSPQDGQGPMNLEKAQGSGGDCGVDSGTYLGNLEISLSRSSR